MHKLEPQLLKTNNRLKKVAFNLHWSRMFMPFNERTHKCMYSTYSDLYTHRQHVPYTACEPSHDKYYYPGPSLLIGTPLVPGLVHMPEKVDHEAL